MAKKNTKNVIEESEMIGEVLAPEKDFSSILRTKKYRQIRDSLISQLETNGSVIIDEKDKNNTFGKHYLDLIDDYMSMWVAKQLLIEDIKLRGVSVYYYNGGGQMGYKKNDSVDQLVKINAQMLRLLSDIGIKPSTIGGVGDDL
jgi:hypothetical protein